MLPYRFAGLYPSEADVIESLLSAELLVKLKPLPLDTAYAAVHGTELHLRFRYGHGCFDSRPMIHHAACPKTES